MKTNMAETSLMAHDDLIVERKIQPQELRVLESVERNGPQTREELAQSTGLRLSAVCGRVNTLIARKRLTERGTRLNAITRKHNKLVDLYSLQRDLFGGYR